MTKFYLLTIFSIILSSNNINTSISGDPGEIIAVRVNNENIASNNLKVDIKGNIYELIPLPFNRQGELILVNNKNILINKKDFGESRITIKNTSMVNLSDEDSKRAYKESQLIKKTLDLYTIQIKPEFNFIQPVEGIISSKYGKRRFINDLPRSPHLALDIAAPTGTKIISPSKGKIVLIGNFFYAGNYIIIDHGHGLLSSYSHLSSINVVENELVKKGHKIGEIGSTGRVTGPHLHWTVYLNKVRINPESIIKENYLESLL